MTQEAYRVETDRTVDTTDMTDLFSCRDKAEHEGVTLDEAARTLNLSERTIQRRLKQGSLKGYKVSGPRGPEWRIHLESWQDMANIEVSSSEDTTFVEAASTEDTTSDKEGTTFNGYSHLLGFYQSQITSLQEKLEAATYRNGYLEAQLTGAETQLKLLPDFEAKASEAETLKQKVSELEAELRRSWWARFSSWFVTGR